MEDKIFEENSKTSEDFIASIKAHSNGLLDGKHEGAVPPMKKRNSNSSNKKFSSEDAEPKDFEDSEDFEDYEDYKDYEDDEYDDEDERPARRRARKAEKPSAVTAFLNGRYGRYVIIAVAALIVIAAIANIVRSRGPAKSTAPVMEAAENAATLKEYLPGWWEGDSGNAERPYEYTYFSNDLTCYVSVLSTSEKSASELQSEFVDGGFDSFMVTVVPEDESQDEAGYRIVLDRDEGSRIEVHCASLNGGELTVLRYYSGVEEFSYSSVLRRAD